MDGGEKEEGWWEGKKGKNKKYVNKPESPSMLLFSCSSTDEGEEEGGRETIELLLKKIRIDSKQEVERRRMGWDGMGWDGGEGKEGELALDWDGRASAGIIFTIRQARMFARCCRRKVGPLVIFLRAKSGDAACALVQSIVSKMGAG